MKHEKLLCSALCLSLSFSLFACSKASTGETSFIIERRETEDARESEPDSSITTENTTSEETVETTPETTVKEIIVRDAYYEEVYNEYLQDYLEVHIPEIIIGDLDMKDLNSEIYAKLEHVSRSKVTYEYYIGKGFLSLNISVEPFHDESPADSFYVYNISTETGNVLSRDEMIELCNIDEDAMDSANAQTAVNSRAAAVYINFLIRRASFYVCVRRPASPAPGTAAPLRRSTCTARRSPRK